jgi:hypothetical protein
MMFRMNRLGGVAQDLHRIAEHTSLMMRRIRLKIETDGLNFETPRERFEFHVQDHIELLKSLRVATSKLQSQR